MVYCYLEEKNSQLKFVFAETHLKAMPGSLNQMERFKEVAKIKNFFS